MNLSIVIPTRNEANRIADAVAGAWQLEPTEVVVVDGNSDDRTPVLARQAGARVLHAPPGRGVQLRVGCEACQGDVILMLHADTRLPAAARQQLQLAFSDSAVDCTFFRQQIEHPAWIYRWLERANAYRGRCWSRPYGDQGLAVRRSTLELLGGVPPVPLLEDVLLMRLLAGRSAPRELPGPLRVDARRWQRRGVLRQTLLNWTILLAWRCGVPPPRLAQWYRAKETNSPTPDSTPRTRSKGPGA